MDVAVGVLATQRERVLARGECVRAEEVEATFGVGLLVCRERHDLLACRVQGDGCVAGAVLVAGPIEADFIAARLRNFKGVGGGAVALRGVVVAGTEVRDTLASAPFPCELGFRVVDDDARQLGEFGLFIGGEFGRGAGGLAEVGIHAAHGELLVVGDRRIEREFTVK